MLLGPVDILSVFTPRFTCSLPESAAGPIYVRPALGTFMRALYCLGAAALILSLVAAAFGSRPGGWWCHTCHAAWMRQHSSAS
jgi:hypothetical protein